MKETHEKFYFKNIKEVVQFEKCLKNYLKSNTGLSTLHFSLEKAYKLYIQSTKKNRLFYSLFDIYLNYCLLVCDRSDIGTIWNNTFSKEQDNLNDLYSSQMNFNAKMDMHRFNNSFILRYRAIWDKIMGVIILVYDPSSYDSFLKSKSRRTKFARIAEKIKKIPTDFIELVTQRLESFENTFRTPEAHGTGRLRIYSFLVKEAPSNPEIELYGYHNFLVEVIVRLSVTLKIRDE